MDLRRGFLLSFLSLSSFAVAQATKPKEVATSRTIVGQPPEVLSTYAFFPPIDPQRAEGEERSEIEHGFMWSIPGPQNAIPYGRVKPYARVGAVASFPGIVGAGNIAPSDSTLAVGPLHVLETVNSTVAIYDKSTGAQTFQQTFATFFAIFGHSIYDPKVIYDPFAKRFLMVALYSNQGSGVSELYLAVSDDDDPNGTWFKHTLDARATIGGKPGFWDFMGFGYNSGAYALAGDMFAFANQQYTGGQILVIPKASLLSGGSPTIHQLFPPDGVAFQICETLDPNEPRLYCVAKTFFPPNTLTVLAINNPSTAPTISASSLEVPAFEEPDFTGIPTPNGKKLNGLDGRFMKAVFRSGKLVTAHTVQAGGDTRHRIRWYEIALNGFPAANPTLSQSGEILGLAGEHYHNAAVTMNAANDIACVFNRTSTTIATDIMVCGRSISDAPGTMGTPVLVESSAGNYTGSSASLQRWGDYAGICVDPADDFTFWGVNMNASPPTSSFNWKTTFFKVQVSIPSTLSSLSLARTKVAGGESTTGTVSIPAALEGNSVVGLSTNSSVIVVPGSVVIPGGSTSANFPIATKSLAAAASRQVMAYAGVNTKSASLLITPSLKSLTLSPAGVVGGASTTGIVTLLGPAPAGGQVVALSDNTGVVTTPTSTTVTAGATARSFPITTSGVSATSNRLVTATIGSIVKNAVITLAPGLENLTLDPSIVVGGQNSTGTVALRQTAPFAITVALADNSSAITPPASATVAAGSISKAFTVATSPVTATATRQVTATLAGVTKTAMLTLTP